MGLETFTTDEIQLMYDRTTVEPGAISRSFTTCLCGDVAAKRLGVEVPRSERNVHPKLMEIYNLSTFLYVDLFGPIREAWNKRGRPSNFGLFSRTILGEELERRKSEPKRWVDLLIESTKEIKETVAHCFCLWA